MIAEFTAPIVLPAGSLFAAISCGAVLSSPKRSEKPLSLVATVIILALSAETFRFFGITPAEIAEALAGIQL